MVVVVVVVAHRTPHRSVPSIERVDRWDKTIGLGVGAAGAATRRSDARGSGMVEVPRHDAVVSWIPDAGGDGWDDATMRDSTA